ncbi:MAG: HAD-IB family hydrolase [Polyangiales bacterium]|nr:HAD-IB family hydrolase [Myxococcales bacterium]
MRAAFFDMDKTLVRVNTGRLYVRWRFARREASWREVARATRWLAEYALGIVDPAEITEKALATLEGVSEEAFIRELEGWYAEHVRPHVSADARREVERRRAEGYRLVVLTASTPYAAGPLARELDIETVLASELEVVDGRFTGRCAQLAYGAGKVSMAEAWAAREGVDLEESVFYTDSVSDVPMLERVGGPYVVNPDVRLAWRARRSGWPVSRWR